MAGRGRIVTNCGGAVPGGAGDTLAWERRLAAKELSPTFQLRGSGVSPRLATKQVWHRLPLAPSGEAANNNG